MSTVEIRGSCSQSWALLPGMPRPGNCTSPQVPWHQLLSVTWALEGGVQLYATGQNGGTPDHWKNEQRRSTNAFSKKVLGWCGESGAFECYWHNTVRNSMMGPQKIQYTIILWSRIFTSVYVPPNIENRLKKGSAHPCSEKYHSHQPKSGHIPRVLRRITEKIWCV